MAITLPTTRYSTTTTTTTTAASFAPRRAQDDDGNDSDGGRGRGPPPASAPRDKDAKKRVYPCWMCHKAFDRPSTLKKHLLVHTGEKAYACAGCGRRFGVASNLTRHGKTCRAANAAGASGPASASAAGPARAGSEATSSSAASAAASVSPAPPPAAPLPSAAPSRKRKSDSPAEGASTAVAAGGSARGSARTSEAGGRKRARRAPSPSRWVPESLSAFDLTPTTKGTPVPLPPVQPFRNAVNAYVEERNSFDENMGEYPYHPREWCGRLPGPGLLGANVVNTSGGQLLVF